MNENPPPPIKLIKRLTPCDVKAGIKQIDGEAERGEIKGAAHILIYDDFHFDFLLTGECQRNPLYTRCLVAELDDELSLLTK